MELKGTTAVITGSSGHLGGQIALSLGAVGCNCLCHYHGHKEKAVEAAGLIEAMGVEAMAVGADLRDSDKIEEMFAKAAGLGTPRILINSAAVFSRQPLEDVSFENAQKVLGINLTAPILVSKVFANIVKEQLAEGTSTSAKIINISDVGGIRGWAEYVVYCSSKAGLIGATKAMARELAPKMCVNSVAVGLASWPEGFDEKEKERQLSMIPMKRIAEAKEITESILFLLRNDYITGQVLNVDGGRVM